MSPDAGFGESVLVRKDDYDRYGGEGVVRRSKPRRPITAIEDGKDLRTGLPEGATEFREMRDDLLKSGGVLLTFDAVEKVTALELWN